MTPGNERRLAHSNAVIAGLRVGDNFAGIFASGESLPDEFIETKLLRPSYFNSAIQW